MTPVSLNPPAPNSLLQPQNSQFFISPINQDSPPTFFNLLDPTQTTFQKFGDFTQNHHHQGDHNKVVLHDGSSSNEQVYNSSEQPARSARDTKNLTSLEEDSKNGHGSTKWMSSKMRLMKKMMRPSSSGSGSTDKAIMMNAQRHENRYSQTSPARNNNTTVRVCSDCNTNSTPLWRSGPMGPKTLCNACGIRQRKARRAMAEAANGSTKTKVHNKDKKKPLVNNFTQFKNKNKSTSGSSSTTTTTAGSSQDVKKLECYALNLKENSDFQGVFLSDEVAEAALLLMDISCGYIYS